MRGGKAIPLKAMVDEALAMGGCDALRHVVVYRRTGAKVAWQAHDRWLHEITEAQPSSYEPEWVGAEHPLFLLYTSARPASRRACSTAAAATCCMPP